MKISVCAPALAAGKVHAYAGNVNAPVLSPLKTVFRSGRTRSLQWRRSQLAALQHMLLAHRKQWQQALAADLGKSAFDAWNTEISQVTAEISHTRKHLKSWLKSDRAKTPLALQPASSRVRHDPLGTVLIIAPWNYPLQLMLSPLVGAIAGGNCVVLKPSEVSTHVEALLEELVPQYLDPHAIQVITGGATTVNALIDEKPDKVFFTGSSQVGALIAQRCASLLVPVTLELGGKSPAYVHHDANLTRAAQRIVWGKFLNAGQTCIAPDHVYVHRKVANRFVRAVEREIRKQFGKNPRKSKNFGRMITTKHAQRVADLISEELGTEIRSGADVDLEARYIEPTVLYPATDAHPSMQKEIFGPVLPIVPVDAPATAIKRILKRPKPLALYLFTHKKRVHRQFLNGVPSGGVALNATVIHVSSPHIPFGGVNDSGIGNYHGEWSFRAFTHERAIVNKPNCPNTLALITPPVNPLVRKLVTSTLLPGGRVPKKDLRRAQKLQKK